MDKEEGLARPGTELSADAAFSSPKAETPAAPEHAKQRLSDDCTICCITMATGKPYDHVMDVARSVRLGYRPGHGTYSSLQVCAALGEQVRSFSVGDQFLAIWVWGRRAILSVPTLNGYAGDHDVYWDGRHLHDPSNGATYPDDLNAIPRVSQVTVFQERAE